MDVLRYACYIIIIYRHTVRCTYTMHTLCNLGPRYEVECSVSKLWIFRRAFLSRPNEIETYIPKLTSANFATNLCDAKIKNAPYISWIENCKRQMIFRWNISFVDQTWFDDAFDFVNSASVIPIDNECILHYVLLMEWTQIHRTCVRSII